MTWLNARAECNKKGMDLVNLETPEENECVKSFLTKEGVTKYFPKLTIQYINIISKKNCTSGKYSNFVFQGLNRIGQTKYDKWLSGAPVTYTNWGAGHPTFEYHCAALQ
jgi:Lectin C-type domain